MSYRCLNESFWNYLAKRILWFLCYHCTLKHCETKELFPGFKMKKNRQIVDTCLCGFVSFSGLGLRPMNG